MRKYVDEICNPKTFESIFAMYAKDLKRFIFFKTQDMAVAEDILQDTFLKLWDNCDKVNHEKVKSYLFTVANHIFLNKEKHKKVVRNHKLHIVKGKNIESPEFLLIEKEFFKKIETTIAALPEKQKEVFLLNRIEKKKYKEIAIMLNVSIKTVEKRMHLALVQMRKQIGNV